MLALALALMLVLAVCLLLPVVLHLSHHAVCLFVLRLFQYLHSSQCRTCPTAQPTQLALCLHALSSRSCPFPYVLRHIFVQQPAYGPWNRYCRGHQNHDLFVPMKMSDCLSTHGLANESFRACEIKRTPLTKSLMPTLWLRSFKSLTTI